MKKLSVTYRPGKGEAKVVEGWGGITLFADKPETLTVDDAIYDEMKVNRFLELGKATEVSEADAQAEKDKAATPQPEHHKK